MNITVPFEIGDIVYAIDYMESTETNKKFYTITSAVIFSITFYTSKEEKEENNVLLETSEGEQWGMEIPLTWISKDKKDLIKKLITLL